jgi:hypothetical protein
MLFEIIFLFHWLFTKVFEKIFSKDLQKQAKWCKCVQNVKLEEIKHAYLEIFSIGLIRSNLCTSVRIQTSYISTLYICFGLCWHQTPKRGRLKGNGLNISYNRFWCLASITVTPGFEGKPNANHVRARIRNSRTQRLHK